MDKKLTDAEWDVAFSNMEASDRPEELKAYCRRTWTFIREGKGYSRRDFTLARASKQASRLDG